MKWKLILFSLTLFIFMIMPVKAVCSYNESSLLNEYIRQIDYSFSSNSEDSVVVNFNNVNNNLYLEYNNQKFYSTNNKVNIPMYTTGDIQDVRILGNSICKDEFINSIFIKTPFVNPFYGSEDCKEYPEFKYCSKLVDKELDTDEFTIELTKYLGTLEENQSDKTMSDVDDLKGVDAVKEKNQKNEFSNIYVYIGVGILCLIMVIIVVVLLKKKRKI